MKILTDEVIAVRCPGKCEITQKPIEISPEYYKSMEKYKINFNPGTKKKIRYQFWGKDPFGHGDK